MTFDLTAFEGETIQIRFRFASDGYVSEEGWYVDDVQITSTGPETGVDEPVVPMLFALKQNAPNPFNPTTVIHYQLPQAADVKVEIFNVAGRLVRTLVDDAQDAGFRSVVWDGTSDDGRGRCQRCLHVPSPGRRRDRPAENGASEGKRLNLPGRGALC